MIGKVSNYHRLLSQSSSFLVDKTFFFDVIPNSKHPFDDQSLQWHGKLLQICKEHNCAFLNYCNPTILHLMIQKRMNNNSSNPFNGYIVLMSLFELLDINLLN